MKRSMLRLLPRPVHESNCKRPTSKQSHITPAATPTFPRKSRSHFLPPGQHSDVSTPRSNNLTVRTPRANGRIEPPQQHVDISTPRQDSNHSNVAANLRNNYPTSSTPTFPPPSATLDILISCSSTLSFQPTTAKSLTIEIFQWSLKETNNTDRYGC